MTKSRKRRTSAKRSRAARDGAPRRDTTFQLSADGVALSLERVRNPLPRGTFGNINRFFRVSSDRPFSRAPILIPYESRDARLVDELTLSLFRFDEEQRSLVLVPDSQVNVSDRYVFGEIPSPGIYGLIGLPKDERVLRTIAVINAIDPAEFGKNKALLPKVCGLILCARGPGGGPAGGNLCDLCLGLEIPRLGLPEGVLFGKKFPGRGFEPVPPPPKFAPWPMYGHDPRHTGRSIYAGPAATPNVRWTFTPSLSTSPQMTYPGLSHPVVDANGTVYIGAQGKSPSGVHQIAIWALDGATGVVLWSHVWVTSTYLVFFVPQPAVGPDGTIYANAGNAVFAFKPDGSTKWSVNRSNLIPQSPLPDIGSTVYVFNWRHVTGAPENGLYAIDAANGSLKWPAPFDTGTGGGFMSTAVKDDGSIIVAAPHVWALGVNRSVLWQHTLSGVIALEGSPAVADDGTIYVGVRPVPLTTANLRALSPNGNAKPGWTAPPWSLVMPALADDGTVYIAFKHNGWPWGGAKLDARNPDGSLKWTRAIPGEVPEAPAIGGDGTIYLVSGYQYGPTGASVYALDPATGLDRWTLPLGPWTWAQRSPAIGLNGMLYVVDESTGTLLALK